jgi:hypothetical protein
VARRPREVGAALDDANSHDDVVWNEGEFQDRVGKEMRGEDAEAQKEIHDLDKEVDSSSEGTQKELEGKYASALKTINDAGDEIKRDTDAAGKQGQQAANEIIHDGDHWDITVGHSVAEKAVMANKEALDVAAQTEGRFQKLSGQDAYITNGAKQLQAQIQGDVHQAAAIGVYLERYGLKRQHETEQAREQALATIARLREKAKERGANFEGASPVIKKMEHEEMETSLLQEENKRDRKTLVDLLGRWMRERSG